MQIYTNIVKQLSQILLDLSSQVCLYGLYYLLCFTGLYRPHTVISISGYTKTLTKHKQSKQFYHIKKATNFIITNINQSVLSFTT